MQALTAADIIRLLGLEPHPEGGHYRQTFRDRVESAGARRFDSHLFPAGARRNAPIGIASTPQKHGITTPAPRSNWKFHFDGKAPVDRIRLGADLAAGERPQAVVPRSRLAGGEVPR